MNDQQPNPGKNLIINIEGVNYARLPIKTHLITPKDSSPADIVKSYIQDIVKAKDIIFVSEKIISVLQGRSYPINEIKPSKMAKMLSRHVYKNPGGIGLASPETMQLAIDEVGLCRILLAAAVAAVTKPLGLKGMFYRVAGNQAMAIDGPVPYAIPPYNKYASKGPKDPYKVAADISKAIGHPTAIVDANDFGVVVLGASANVDKKLMAKALKDNPLGQSDESTPIGILRKL